MKQLLLLLAFSTLYSCGTKSAQHFAPSDSIKINAAKTTPFDALDMLAPEEMMCIDEYLIISQNNIDTQLVKVFDSNTLQNVANYGIRGEALTEILSLGNIDGFRDNEDSLSLGIIDYNRGCYHEYNINNTKYNNTIFTALHECNMILRVDNNKMLTSTLFDSTKFFLYENNIVIDSLPLLPPKPNGVNILTHSLACSGWLSINPNKTIAVASYIYDGGIDVVEITGDKLAHRWSFRIFNMDYTTKETHGFQTPIPTKSSKYGYTSSTISNKYIYVLFSGKLFMENNTGSSDVIHVFDYDGKHIRKIILDNEVTNICIDKNDNKLYAIAIDPIGNYRLVEYTVPQYSI